MKRIYHLPLVLLIIPLILSCSKDEFSNEDQPKADSEILKIIEEINADSIASNIKMLENLGTRYALASNRREVSFSILKKFKSYGYTNARLDSFEVTLAKGCLIYTTWQYNVVAELEGNGYPDSLILVGGHHDCTLRATEPQNPLEFAPGADDNASGVAVTLEIARVLKNLMVNPRKTILFATFAAEEFGLHGSNHMAKAMADSSAKIQFMLNNDMVSYCPIQDSSLWYVNIIDYRNSVELRKKAFRFCELYTSLKAVNNNEYQKYSDSYSFYLNNFPSLFFISFHDDPNYHTVNDLAVYQNPKFAREVAKLNCALIIDANK
jgi:hypothetical protein